jgi:hypothetical protein
MSSFEKGSGKKVNTYFMANTVVPKDIHDPRQLNRRENNLSLNTLVKSFLALTDN